MREVETVTIPSNCVTTSPSRKEDHLERPETSREDLVVVEVHLYPKVGSSVWSHEGVRDLWSRPTLGLLSFDPISTFIFARYPTCFHDGLSPRKKKKKNLKFLVLSLKPILSNDCIRFVSLFPLN